MKIKILLSLVICLAAVGISWAQSEFNEKMNMEQSLAGEITGILDKFVGPGKSHVSVMMSVDVKPLSAPISRPGAGPAPIDKNQNHPSVHTQYLWRDVSGKPVSILPGFNVRPEVTIQDDKKKDPKQQPDKQDKAQAVQQPEPLYVMEVKSAKVSIILDQTVPDKYVKMVELMVSEVTGLDPARGDELHVYRLPLISPWQRFVSTQSVIANIFWLFVSVVVAIILLWVLVVGIIKILNVFGVLPPRKVQYEHPENPPAAPLVNAAKLAEQPDAEEKEKKDAVPVEALTAADAAPLKRSLDFIKPHQINLLAELLEGAEAQEIACVIGLLDSDLAYRVLENFNTQKRLSILWLLTWAKSLSPEQLDKVRTTWKQKIEAAYGGTQMVGELLSNMDEGVRKTLLEQLDAKAPELSHKIQKQLIRFEDLFDLRDSDLGLLVQAVQFKEWAIALADMPESLSNRMVNVLPESSKEAFKQWKSLTTAHNGQPAQMRAKILGAARSMERAGKISLHETAGINGVEI